MFKVNVGEKGISYLRPETAQLIFADFKSVYDNSRMKLPFGISQIGKSFRNEIAPKNFLFRSREFEQMELQYFLNPKEVDDCPFYEGIKNNKIKILTSESQLKEGENSLMSLDEMLNKNIFKNKWHVYWLYKSYEWFLSLGVSVSNLRLREHRKKELAHYAQSAVDIEYNFPFGWKEVFGSHDRGQFDLEQHSKFSKKDLSVFDEKSQKKVLPRVIEASFGVERAFLVFMFDAYFKDENKSNIILKLNSKLSPVKAAIFPIIKTEKFEKIAQEIVRNLSLEFNVLYDKSGSIGRRYARNDEIGTPYCITLDKESLKKKEVSIRFRDNGEQVMIKIDSLRDVLRKSIDGEDLFSLGKKVYTRKKK